MDTALLIGIYLITTLIYQTIGFGISRAVDQFHSAAGLLTFLLLYLAAFYIAWPTAVALFHRLRGDRPLRGEDSETSIARRAGKPLEYQRGLDRPA
jgi:hypothetical protein